MIIQEKPVYLLLLGGNIGDVESAMQSALEVMESLHIRVLAGSGIYETPPWGYASDHGFLNKAVIASAPMPPVELLGVIHRLERQAGRPERKKDVYTDRPLDVDILLWGREVYEDTELVIPHPRMHLRRFALAPSCEIAAHWVHPVLETTLAELLRTCPDMSAVKTRETK